MNNKRILLLLAAILFVQLPASAQYLLPEFTVSVAKMRQGLPLREKFNYNTNTQKMEFMDGRDVMALSNPEMVDTLFLGEHKMIPYLTRFLDVVYKDANFSLALDYKSKSVNEGKVIQGWGIKTQGTVQSIDMRSVGQNPDAERMKNLEAWKDVQINTYFVSVKNEMKKFSDAKSLVKIFPEKKEKIEQYVHDHNNTFKDKDLVLALLKSLF